MPRSEAFTLVRHVTRSRQVVAAAAIMRILYRGTFVRLVSLCRLIYLADAVVTANCGHPAGQYDVALVVWRRRTFKSLEVALDWLVGFLRPGGVVVVWVDPQKATANETLRLSLERRGFVIEAGTVHECGCAVSARRREVNPLREAA